MRNKTISVFIMMIFFARIVWGGESIDAQIEAIRKAPPQERFKLMNRLKRQLVQMNQKQRSEAIAKLRAKTAKGHRQPHRTYLKTDMKHPRHLDEYEKIQRMQYMQQHQMGSGISHEMEQEGGGMRPPGSESQGGWGSYTDNKNGMRERGH